jgi:cell division protein FtsI/penicillin-binding protein 2
VLQNIKQILLFFYVVCSLHSLPNWTIKDRNGKILKHSYNVFEIQFRGSEEEMKLVKAWLVENNLKYDASVDQQEILITAVVTQQTLCKIRQNNQLIQPIIIRKYQQAGLYIDATREIICQQTHITPQTEEIFNNQIFHLSIDAELQKYAYEIVSRFPAAAAIVVDVKTGEVLCITSYPDIATIDNVYNAASAIKPFMQQKVLTKSGVPQIFTCGEKNQKCGTYLLNGTPYYCLHNHGILCLQEALGRSCNVAAYTLGEYLNRQDIEEIWSKFGFNDPIFPEIFAMFEPLSDFLSQERLEILWMQIGHGRAVTTLAHLAQAYSRLITNNNVKLTLFKQNNSPVFESLNLNQKHFSMIKDGMHKTLHMPKGTAYQEENYDAGGKTGTGLTTIFEPNEYCSNKDIESKYYTSTFCMFSPFDNPEIVVCVIIPFGGLGKNASIPALKIAKKALKIRGKQLNKISAA